MRLDWFEIPVEDMERAVAFYETVFKIKINAQNFGALAMGWFPPSKEIGAATGTLIKHEAYVPSQEGALLYFNSEDILTELNRVEAAGGTIFREKTQIGEEQGYMGVFIDTEGNRVALHSNQ